jgi:Zn-dependent oligopeptidase
MTYDPEQPLLQEWTTPFSIPPFNLIRPEHFRPAVEEAIAIARKEIEEIVKCPDQPDFHNTIEALENAGTLLNRITPILFNLNSSDTTPELQDAAREVSPVLTAFGNDISLNPELFARVKRVYDSRDSLGLNPEEMILLDRKYKGFVRGGAGLSDEGKEQFRAITVELSTLSLRFEENVLAETNDFTLHLTTEEELSGLPDGAREAASALAEEKGMQGWLFTLHAPSYVPFMQYADRRDLRDRCSENMRIEPSAATSMTTGNWLNGLPDCASGWQNCSASRTMHHMHSRSEWLRPLKRLPDSFKDSWRPQPRQERETCMTSKSMPAGMVMKAAWNDGTGLTGLRSFVWRGTALTTRP